MSIVNLGAKPAIGLQTPENLNIAGFVPLSSVDWEGQLVSTVFLQGCTWDCYYCQNTELISVRSQGSVSWEKVYNHAQKRIGLLDGFVFSGGEPTRQKALPEAVKAIKSLGFKVGLHSCGAFPTLLAKSLPLLDWIGLDIKALPSDYESVTGRAKSQDNAYKSLELVVAEAKKRDSFSYEIRTTIAPSLATSEYTGKLCALLYELGVTNYVLQTCRDEGTRPAPEEYGSLIVDMPSPDFDTSKFDKFIIR